MKGGLGGLHIPLTPKIYNLEKSNSKPPACGNSLRGKNPSENTLTFLKAFPHLTNTRLFWRTELTKPKRSPDKSEIYIFLNN